MKLNNGRSLVALGAALIVISLLAFGMAAPSTTLGQETDVPVQTPDDVGGVGDGPTAPPASLPDTGTGTSTGFRGGIEGSSLLLIGMLAAAGLTLVGTGLVTSRQGWPAQRK